MLDSVVSRQLVNSAGFRENLVLDSEQAGSLGIGDKVGF